MADHTDRELLELAAKAAGKRIFAERQKERDELGFGDVGLWLACGHTSWNPLSSDGDALRLAVKLGISIEFDSPWFAPDETGINARAGTAHALEFIESAADLGTAVRRAIVRAAAEIANTESREQQHG